MRSWGYFLNRFLYFLGARLSAGFFVGEAA